MKFYIFQDRKGEWRWTLVARNGRKVADSGEGYKRKQTAINAVGRLRSQIMIAKIIFRRPKR